jgi:preprotein translocase subunit SecD
MKKNILWRLILIGITVVASIVFFLPNLPAFHSMPEWWKKNMPDKGINLGLDLKGGTHLVFEVEAERAVEITTERISKALSETLAAKKFGADVKTEGALITITPASTDAQTVTGIQSAIKENYPTLIQPEGQTGLLYRLKDDETKRIKDNASEQAIETIRNRIDKLGVAEPSIHGQSGNEIVVQLPGVKDPKRAIEIIGKTAQLEFKLVDDKSPVASELPAAIAPGAEESLLTQFKDKTPPEDEILFEKKLNRETGVVTKAPLLLKKDTLLTGDLLTEARIAIDDRFNEPYVSLLFNDMGEKIFGDVTGKNVGRRLAIILDGTVYSAPVIREQITGGSAQITGSFTMEDAQDLAIVLKAGALPAPVKILQNVTVGPSLGKDSIDAGKKAGIAGFVLVIVFMLFYYRLAGLIADAALVLNILLLLGAMASLNATLTLPGIAGVILAIGMAVDSNVLMFERMREELRSGKTPRAAVDSGYHKAFWTIFDSHVTTLITAAVLFQFGTGPIKGFAVTLSLGVSINLFTALVGTKTMFDILNSRTEVKTLSI